MEAHLRIPLPKMPTEDVVEDLAFSQSHPCNARVATSKHYKILNI